MANMVSGNSLAEVAALIGDVARVNILSALMDGRALTAGELARHAGVTAQTTSGHLAKLVQARLIALEKQGRHRYYRLASPEIAHAMQALMALAAVGPTRYRPVGPRDEALRMVRTCYDHLAGRLAMALVDCFCARGYLILSDGAGLITDEGRPFFSSFGIDFEVETRSRRPLCRTCLDWSERRPHLAGRFGAALLTRLLDLEWLVCLPDCRALGITKAGQRGFSMIIQLPSDWMVAGATAPAGADATGC